MPTIRGIPGPYRFFFYSFDCNEPRHVHREYKTCKFWLDQVSLAANNGFAAHELSRIRRIITDHLEHFIEALG